MKPLPEDLQTPKRSLDEFSSVTKRVLGYLPNVVSDKTDVRGYVILSSVVAGTSRFARPINQELFIFDIDVFDTKYSEFLSVIEKLKDRVSITGREYDLIDAVVYTMQQALGVGMDFLCNPNSSRKHVGNRFEELIRLIIALLEIENDKIVFKIPYLSEEEEKLYSCETDIILSPHSSVKSDTKSIDRNEIVVSLKTTSKDRMGKIFLDKLLMQQFVGHPVKVVGIFLNDVQRKDTENISYTFVSGLFMVYTKFLTKLEGVYFVDPPPITQKAPLNQHILPFSKFIAEDIWNLLSS
jgi:hypothetical protein